MKIFDFLFKKERRLPAVSQIRRAYVKENCPFCRGFLETYQKILRTTPEANLPNKRIEIVDIHKNRMAREYALTISEMAGLGRQLSVPLIIYEGIVIDGFLLNADYYNEMLLRTLMGVPHA